MERLINTSNHIYSPGPGIPQIHRYMLFAIYEETSAVIARNTQVVLHLLGGKVLEPYIAMDIVTDPDLRPR